MARSKKTTSGGSSNVGGTTQPCPQEGTLIVIVHRVSGTSRPFPDGLDLDVVQSVRASGSGGGQSGKTDGNGLKEFKGLVTNLYTVTAKLSGANAKKYEVVGTGRATVSVPAGGSATVNFDIVPLHDLQVRVKVKGTSPPQFLKPELVTLGQARGRYESSSKPNGTWEFKKLHPGTVVIEARLSAEDRQKYGVGTSTKEHLLTETPQPNSAEVEVLPNPNLDVTVVFKKDGGELLPVSDVEVIVGAEPPKKTSKPGGVAKFEKLKPGTYRVDVKLTEAQQSEYFAPEPTQVELIAGTDGKVTLELAPAEANAIRITKLSRWFIPQLETLDLSYRLEGRSRAADQVAMEVWASNYCELDSWSRGLPKFKLLADTPVFTHAFAAEQAKEKASVTHNAWNGSANCSKGILAPGGDSPVRFIHAACSPYTLHLRYFKADADAKARLELTPFWPLFGTDAKATADSLKVKWTVKNATSLKAGKLVVWDRDGTEVFSKDLVEGDVSEGDHTFTWDGKTKDGKDIVEGSMPYRVQIQAHTKKGVPNGLALAALHTEVRVRSHKDRHLATAKDYQPLDDPKDLAVELGPLTTRPAPPLRADGRVWIQHKLALAGFHPGPVDGTTRDSYTLALREFQRSNHKRHSGSGPFERLTPNANENDDTKNALDDLPAIPPRPWFGNPTDRADFTLADASTRLKDPAQNLIVWVDDRHYYTASSDTEIVGTPNQMGDYRQGMSIGDGRTDRDAESIARPWIPLQAQLQLLSKAQQLDTTDPLSTNATHLACMRRATGPLRLDWSFEEIDWDYANNRLGPGPTEHVDNTLYRKDYTRTKTFLEWTLDQLKAPHTRKDIERSATYVNCPATHGGIRPANASIAQYYNKAFGLGDDALKPWATADDSTLESIATCTHDFVGQPAADYHSSTLGWAGVFFTPSRVAGDGYRVRAQLRLTAVGDYNLPNLAVLAARYPRLPQGYTASLRLWRKCSLRAYLKWAGGAGHWGTYDLQFPAFYRPSFIHFVHDGGVSRSYNLTDIFDTSRAAEVNAYKDIVAARVSNLYRLRTKSTMTVDGRYVYPYFNEANLGWPKASAANAAFGSLYDDDIIQGLLNATWRSYRERLMFELVRRMERKYGILRGHIIVEFDASPEYYYERYSCDGVCASTYWYIEKDAAGGTMAGTTCSAPGCSGHHRRAATPVVQASGYNGLPLPAVGTCLGATWIFESGGNAVAETWAHEVGHHKHLEHASSAPGATPAAHDSQANTHGTFAATDAAADRQWDRNCIMSYASVAEQHYFCGKTNLKLRGWKVNSLALPAGNQHDP
ncbi:MAG: FlgD immunoglobulin-like domain containing protein [Opitutaceae bacterium]